ncbi:MAG: FAD-binding protein [Solirubrobacterales bacterium]|nr:FAD-binding protein [Solirubrobacterales bacterium]
MAGRLAAVVGEEHVRDDPGALRVFGQDATPLHRGRPDVVVFPGSTAEVAGVLAVASELGLPVIPRGAGSNLSAGTIADRGGIMLTLTRMDRLLEIDLENLAAVCQPGVTNAALAAAAAGHGLLYPPDPGSRTTSTIGGNVAENAGGLRGLKYGVTRDYLLGCEAVLATGEVIRAGGKLVKEVAGYDLLRLLCGSEGTLAVLTELTLRLVPAPESSGLGLAYFPSLAAAGRAVSRVLRGGVLPATLEFLDAVCIETVEDFAAVGLRRDAGAVLIFGQDGGPEGVQRDVARIAEACEAEGAIEVNVARDAAEGERILDARRAALPSLSRLGRVTLLEDATVPRSEIAAMVERIEAAGARHGLRIGTFGHAGDGNLHPTIVLPDPDDAEAVERAHRAFDEIFQAAIDLGGTITGEHGVGLAKLSFLERRHGADHVALLRRIKHAFDPQGILNPGKLGS